MIKDITGIILCGGKSSRMQNNKALLKLNQKTIIEIILTEMQKIFREVILSTNDCDEYSFLNVPVVKDTYANRGPLSGIYSALKESQTEKNFLTTCDLPLITHQLIDFVSNLSSEKEIVIPTINGEPQRLFGMYNTSVLEKIKEIFKLSETNKSIKGSVYELHQRVSVELGEIAHLPFYSENMFLNMNTPNDYELIKNIYRMK